MKLQMQYNQVASYKASVFGPILKLLYSYKHYDEPEYNKIVFMFEKILLDMNIVPKLTNLDWNKNRNKFNTDLDLISDESFE